MNLPFPEEKVALLLNLLGEQVGSDVLARLDSDQAARIKQSMQLLSESPPTNAESDAILGEFEVFLRFALAAQDAEEEDDGRGAVRKSAHSGGPKILKFEPTDDPMDDLNRLTPMQVAKALAGEQPRTAAMVINGLESVQAAEVIRLLPEDARNDAFLQLNNLPERPSKQLLSRIAQSTFERAVTLEPDELETPDADQKLADTLRVMEKKTRGQMMDVLKAEDPDRAERILALLYVFDDIVRIENRSLQKLLAEVSSDTLTSALTGAAEEISEKIFANLSKRARMTLEDELEFKGHVTDDEVTYARKSIAEVIGKLDQAGELVMDE